jgi:transcription antitermination factor NusG
MEVEENKVKQENESGFAWVEKKALNTYIFVHLQCGSVELECVKHVPTITVLLGQLESVNSGQRSWCYLVSWKV